MIASALIAIIESLRWLVPSRTSARRRLGPIAPTGRSTNAGATRLPSDASRPPCTETGIITRSVRPRVGSFRSRSSRWSAPPTTVSTASFTVPPRASLISLNRWSGASAIANRRLGPICTSSGDAGRAPMSRMLRNPDRTVPTSSAATAGERRTASTPFISAWNGCATRDSVASRSRSCEEGSGSGSQAGGGGSSGSSGERSNSAAVRCMPDSPSIIAWCTFIRVATCPPSRPSIT